ncbi:MAG: hypothetical protein IKD89_00050 [Clostridia bacterium]|nr:hypothetical protein [Clostridia bacterium]
MGFIKCSRNCAYQTYGSCTLESLNGARVCGDRECIYFIMCPDRRKITPPERPEELTSE